MTPDFVEGAIECSYSMTTSVSLPSTFSLRFWEASLKNLRYGFGIRRWTLMVVWYENISSCGLCVAGLRKALLHRQSLSGEDALYISCLIELEELGEEIEEHA